MSSKKYTLLKGLSAVSETLHWSDWLELIKKKKNVALVILIMRLCLASASSIVSSPEPKENQNCKQCKILKQYQILLINYTSSDSEEIICKGIHEHTLNQFWVIIFSGFWHTYLNLVHLYMQVNFLTFHRCSRIYAYIDFQVKWGTYFWGFTNSLTAKWLCLQ